MAYSKPGGILEEHRLTVENIPLRDYIDTRIEAVERATTIALASAKEATNAALVASEKAVDKAEINAKDWRIQNNEWRQAMLDRERTYVPRSEYEASKLSMDKIISDLTKSRDVNAGHGTGLKDMYGWIIAGVGIAIGILSRFF